MGKGRVIPHIIIFFIKSDFSLVFVPPDVPVTFNQSLENVEVKEGDSGVFRCELSKPGAPVDWRKGRVVLKPGYKYEMKQEGRFTKLVVNNVEESDAGKYTCKTNDCQSTAELTVKGESKISHTHKISHCPF